MRDEHLRLKEETQIMSQKTGNINESVNGKLQAHSQNQKMETVTLYNGRSFFKIGNAMSLRE